MKAIFLLITVFAMACGPAMDANNFVRNSNASSNTNAAPTGTPDAALIKQLEEIAKESKGKVGVSAVLIETGETVGINQNEHFAMQSVVKLPISMAVMKKRFSDRKGILDDESLVAISKQQYVPPNMRSPLRDSKRTEITLRELLRFAISESDGTASDVLQGIAGDAIGVQSYIDSRGISDMKVKYTHKEFGNDWPLQYENWSTPEAAVSLLKRLWFSHAYEGKDLSLRTELGSGLAEGHAEVLLKFMTETNNPAGRIKGLLPPGTVVAHKTGTGGMRDGITSATNDIGVITLPNGNHIAIAVFVGDSSGDQQTREGVIAKISKAIFDKWNK
jgi:beta-lactamase class A